MPKKILLISSNFEEISLITASLKTKTGIKTTDNSHYALGLGYLHAYLEKCDNIVKTLFLNNHGYAYCFDKINEALIEFKPDFVGFQIFTANRDSSFRLIDFIHQQYPNIKIIAGGVHATIMYEQIIRKFPYIIIVLGEGEITSAELVDELRQTNPRLEKIDGIAFYRDGKIITNSARKLIENLDELPFPKHEIFFHPQRFCGNIITSRGCPFNCSFCCLDKISLKRVRKRSVANVIAEIEYLIKEFPQITDIWIHDDTFFIDNQRAIDLCDEIINRGIKINFTCSGRIKPLTQELVCKLEAAGFKKVLLGLESGDNDILQRCHKGITQQDVIDAFKLFAKSKIIVFAFLIVGLPGETRETISETARIVKKLQKIKYMHYHSLALLTVYPGTEVYEIAKNGGLIDDDYWLTDNPTPVYTLENDYNTLLEFQELLLNHISMNRLFTSFTGFKNQYSMLPSIIKYILNDKNNLKRMSFLTLQYFLPKKFFLSILSIRRKFKNNMDIIKKIKLIIKTILYPQQTLQARRVNNYKSHGGNNLRYQYDLKENSVVFDLGGYQGEWTNEIFTRFQPYIYIFEPVAEYAHALKNKYLSNKKIKIFAFGLSNTTKDEIIFENNNSSSLYIKNGKPQNIKLVASDIFFRDNNVQKIDLMKINIEGGEYDLLENLISTGDVKKINNIQVQFHDFVLDGKKRMHNIQENLKKTHHLTYQFEFVWENWEINKN